MIVEGTESEERLYVMLFKKYHPPPQKKNANNRVIFVVLVFVNYHEYFRVTALFEVFFSNTSQI